MSAYSISQHLLCAEASSVRICACVCEHASSCVPKRVCVCVCDSWPPWAQCYFTDPSHLLRVMGDRGNPGLAFDQ